MKKTLAIFVVVLMLFSVVASLVACNTEDKTSFFVSFYDEEGRLLKNINYKKDEIPSYTYTKPDTDDYTFTFEGWATTAGGEVLKQLPKVTADAKYYAVVSKTKKAEEIAFSGNEKTSDEVKNVAAASMRERFDEAVKGMSDEARAKAEALYAMCTAGIQNINGPVDEVKNQANQIYADLCRALDVLSTATNSYQSQKEQLLAELQVVYNAVKAAVGEVPVVLEAAYKVAKAAIEEAVETVTDSAALQEIFATFKAVAQEAINSISTAKLKELKDALSNELEALVNGLLQKLEDADLKKKLTDFWNEQKAKLEGIVSMEDITAKLNEIRIAVTEKLQSVSLEQLKNFKDRAKAEIQSVWDSLSQKIEDSNLKAELEQFIASQKARLDQITSLDDIKTKLDQIKNSVVEKGQTVVLAQLQKFKDNVKTEIDSLVAAVTQKIEDADLKGKLQKIVDDAKAKVDEIVSLDDIKTKLVQIKDEVVDKIALVTAEQLQKIKDAVKAELEARVNGLIQKLEDANIKENLQAFWDEQKAKIEQIVSLDQAKEALETIKADTLAKVREIVGEKISQYTTALKAELDGVIAAALEKISDEDLQEELQEFYNSQKAKIDAIDSLENYQEVLDEIRTETVAKATEVLASQLQKLKADLKKELDQKVNAVLEKLSDEDLKTQISEFYIAEVAKIEAVDSFESANTVFAEVRQDVANKIKELGAGEVEKLKKAAQDELDEAVNALLQKIEDDDLKQELQAFYAEESAKIDAIDSLDKAAEVLEEVKSDTLLKANEISQKQIAKWQKTVSDKLDTAVAAALEKISDNELKQELNAFYADEKAKIVAVDSLDSAKATLAEIEQDTLDEIQKIISAQLQKVKAAAKAQLDAIVLEYTEKIEDTELKAELRSFYQTEIAKVEAVNSLDDAKATLDEIVEDTRNFAKELAARKIAALKEEVKNLLSTLTTVTTVSPFDYLPAAMCPDYSANLVSENSLITDYTDFVRISDINCGGFGAQWNMVVENINMVNSCYKFVSAGDSLVTAALSAVNVYLSSKYSETINTEISNESYTVRFAFDNQILNVFVEYKTGITLPAVGSIVPQIDLTLNTNGEKVVKISLAEGSAIKFVVEQNKFECGAQLNLSQLKVAFYCVIENNQDGTTSGSIYEFLTVSGKEVKSAAEFYIGENYATVVGNKVDSIVGFKGTVCELYNKSQGKLLGFEVKETSNKNTYNTLWFNLCDVDNLTNIKVTEKDKNGNVFSENDTFINNSEDAFYVETKSLLDPSRKYDVEMKLRYFYGTNSQGELEKYEVQLPMLFVQEACLDSFASDMAIAKHNNWTTSILTSQVVLDTIKSEYSTRIPVFEENKENKTRADVETFLGA